MKVPKERWAESFWFGIAQLVDGSVRILTFGVISTALPAKVLNRYTYKAVKNVLERAMQ